MPLFRRKPASAPVPVPLPGPQPQQHWVAYIYDPQPPQPPPMPPMYALQSTGPYPQHPTFPFTPNAGYGQLPLQYRPIVQYPYQQSSTTHPADSPQYPTNSLPKHVRSKVETLYQQPQPRRRAYSGSQPAPPIFTAPGSRGGEADRFSLPYASDYTVEVQTQPAKQSVLRTLVDMARGRSKSRGRGEVPPPRPRSRGSFVDDGHNRERGRAKDPRERRISIDKKVKHETQRSFEKAMMETLEKTFKEEQEGRARRSSAKDDLKRKYEAEDRLREQEEYQRTQSRVPPIRPSSRNRATSPDCLSDSPTLRAHTKMNALPQFQPRNTDAGYHTDAPTSKSSRRSSMPLHRQVQRPDLTSLGSSAKIPEGFFNRRGDQLMNSKGDVLRRPQHLEYPPEFANYPHPGTGWQDHKGQLVGPDLRWIRKVG